MIIRIKITINGAEAQASAQECFTARPRATQAASQLRSHRVQRRGNKHIGLSAREVLPKVADPQSFLSFTGLSCSYVETTRGKIWKGKKKEEEMFVFVSLLCRLHFWSVELVDLTSTAVVIYIVL